MSESISKLNTPSIKIEAPKKGRQASQGEESRSSLTSIPRRSAGPSLSLIFLWLIFLVVASGGAYAIYFLYQNQLQLQTAVSDYSERIKIVETGILENGTRLAGSTKTTQEALEGQRVAMTAREKVLMTEIQKFDKTLQDFKKEIKELQKINKERMMVNRPAPVYSSPQTDVQAPASAQTNVAN